MGVRNIFPNSISFVVTVQTRGRRFRVEILLDLQERLIFVPSGLLPDICDRLPDFIQQLSDITANHLAHQRWDGVDPFTEYQTLEILLGYTIQRSYLRFNVILDGHWLMPVSELDERSLIQLE